MTDKPDIVADLTAEGDDFNRMLDRIDASGWALATPAAGWTVQHQLAHLTATFRLAALSVSAPDRFTALTAKLSPDFDANVEHAMAEFVPLPPGDLKARWREAKGQAEGALAAVPGDRIVPWLVRPLPAAVLAAAGIMELFAHGQDIADALGVQRQHTDRIFHLVEFGVRAWDFGFLVRGLTPPEQGFRYEITAPSGELWTFGPDDAAQRVSGPAVDFCLLITRRRHRDDLAVTAEGADADQWLGIAQAYRGPAGPGRRPGQFAKSTAH